MSSLVFSLRGRLLFLICLASLPAILFAFFAAQNERAAALDRVKREGLQLATMTSREHSHQIRGAREILTWLGAKAASDGAQSPIFTDPDFLRVLLAGHPQLANIGVLSPDGRVLSSAYPLSSYRTWRDNPAYLAALNSDTVEAGSYVISPIFVRPTLNHAYAVRDADHQVIAVLFNGLNLDWLEEMTRYADLPIGISVLIADRGGHVLVSATAAGLDSQASSHVRLPGMPDLAQSDSGELLTMESTGVRCYVVAAPLEQTPGLYVAATVPYEQVIGQTNTTFYRTLLSLGLLTLFTIIAVFVAAEIGVLRGVRSLARTVHRFGTGDLSARVKVSRGRNEFASLAKSFNTMAVSLANRHAEACEAQRRLRALASRVQMAREEEAVRISRELHDEMAQALTALKIELLSLKSCCPADRQADNCVLALRQNVMETTDRIAAMLDLVRRISSELRPGVLDKLGLTAALQWQAGEIEARTNLAIQVEADGDGQDIDETVSLTLFRIAQEVLTNVIRHAGAGTVEINLTTLGEEIVLRVRDDGKGISMAAIDSVESLGIIGIRERATLIGGLLSICGTQGQGTTVTVTVPAHPTLKAVDEYSAG